MSIRRWFRGPFFLFRSGPEAGAVRGGCSSAIFTCVISMLFLLLNVWLVQAGFTVLSAISPRWTREPRVGQAAVLLGPIALLMIEWWLVEFIADQLAGNSTRKRRKRPET